MTRIQPGLVSRKTRTQPCAVSATNCASFPVIGDANDPKRVKVLSTELCDVMKDDRDAATRYRKRAEELRVIAQTTPDPEAKQTLLEIASDYERLAVTRERIDEDEQKRKRER